MSILRNLVASTERWYSFEGEVYFPLFDSWIALRADKAATREYVERCAAYLNGFDAAIANALLDAAARYRADFRAAVGEDDAPLATDALKREIRPTFLYVPEPERDEPVAHLALDVDWEEEHGMEWLVRGARVLYVGPYNSVNPWGEFAERKSWNYTPRPEPA